MHGRKKVAVVGSGCSGLAAVWALKSTEHEIHLYEAADRLGGHTNTVTWEHNGHKTNVDSGFIVMNSATYRSLLLIFISRIWLLTSKQPISSRF